MRITPDERYRGLLLTMTHLEKALDRIRPIVTTEAENKLRCDIKDALQLARELMTVASDERP